MSSGLGPIIMRNGEEREVVGVVLSYDTCLS